MKTALRKLEFLFPCHTHEPCDVGFVRGSAQFDSSGKKTPHGVVYECDFRFALPYSPKFGPRLLTLPSVIKLTFDDVVIVIGSAECPAYCTLESVDPDVYRVEYTSLKPF